LKWWRCITGCYDTQAVGALLFITVWEELCFEYFEDSWDVRRCWLLDGTTSYEAEHFGSWPKWLGFVFPARSVCSS
jgi:hypothetical protein